MPDQVGTSQVIRFATFEADLQAQELRKAGLRLKLSGQPFQVLAILLEQPGVVVTREELQKRLWPDTFVDVDHNLNTAINKIREALGDSSENPRFVETLPRRGYRFIAPITMNGTAAAAATDTPENRSTSVTKSAATTRPLLALGLLGTVMVLVAGGLWIYKRSEPPRGHLHNACSRASLSMTACRASPHGHPTADTSPTARTAAGSSISGCSR